MRITARSVGYQHATGTGTDRKLDGGVVGNLDYNIARGQRAAVTVATAKSRVVRSKPAVAVNKRQVREVERVRAARDRSPIQRRQGAGDAKSAREECIGACQERSS